MASTSVAVINASTVLTDVQVQQLLPALQIQVHRDLLPVWGVDADLSFVGQGMTPAPGSWWLTILDNSDQADALGYHETTNDGLPLAKVFAASAMQDGVQWTVTASHELLEMLVDPEINLTVFVQPTDVTGTLYAYEVCDACEADQFGYKINDVLVSDFVYPTWFESARTAGSVKFDFMNQLNGPLPQLLAGGYIGVFDVGSGSGWHQVSAMRSAEVVGARRVHPPPGSRRDRRAVPRSQWRKSLAKFGTGDQLRRVAALTASVPTPTTRINDSIQPRTMAALRQIGSRRRNAIQIVPPRDLYRPSYLRAADMDDHELVTRPLESPTGPGGAPGFRNRAGSQIQTPKVTNVYLGDFWGNRAFFEGFCKAVVENGYLDPLKELDYGTGPGTYQGYVDGQALPFGSTFADSDAQSLIASMLDRGALKADEDTLFFLCLPAGVNSTFDGSASCTAYCGYHEAFEYQGLEVAYAIMPSPTGCNGCGNGNIGDFTATYAHELAEACTDKVPGQGWVADDGSEDGDLEAWIMIPWGPTDDPQRYTVQGYYTNERGNTVGAWR